MRSLYHFKRRVKPSPRSRDIGTASQRRTTDSALRRSTDGAPNDSYYGSRSYSSDGIKAYPIASDAPTTSPSHGNTSSVHGESPRPIPEKRYVLVHPLAPCTLQLQHQLPATVPSKVKWVERRTLTAVCQTYVTRGPAVVAHGLERGPPLRSPRAPDPVMSELNRDLQGTLTKIP